MRLEFVQQVDGTIITKVLKVYSPSFIFKLKSGTGTANAALAPMALIYRDKASTPGLHIRSKYGVLH